MSLNGVSTTGWASAEKLKSAKKQHAWRKSRVGADRLNIPVRSRNLNGALFRRIGADFTRAKGSFPRGRRPPMICRLFVKKKTRFRRTASLVGSAKVHNLEPSDRSTFKGRTAILVFFPVRDSCERVLADRASLVLSSVLVEDTAVRVHLLLGRHDSSDERVSSPAPSSRGPLCPVSPGIQTLGLSPFDVALIAETVQKRRASFRMPSDETLRVSLVCTLPLLHFSPSLVAVVHVCIEAQRR